MTLVDQIESRYAELERQMSDPELHADRERAAEVGREYRELQGAHELAREWLTPQGRPRGRPRAARRGWR